MMIFGKMISIWRKMLNTAQIEYFLAVAECLNFTKASQITYTTQPTISKQIALLEKEIGIPLFVRTKQAVSLTPAGMAFYKDVRVIFKSLIDARRKAVHIGENTSYGLTISIADHINASDINLAIRKFQAKYPNSRILVESEDFRTLRINLVKEKCDLAISMEYFLSGLEDIKFQLISRQKLFLAIPKVHPLSQKPGLTITDFQHETFFILNAASNPRDIDIVYDICGKCGFTPRTEACNSLESYFIKLELGYGVAIFDTSIRFPENFDKSFIFIDIPGDEEYAKVSAAWNRNNSNPALQLFLKELKSIIEDQDMPCPKIGLKGKDDNTHGN
jgi:DNA-binding transcriptional LysR family regulator